jgi:pyruvate/2-oxoacid:ferredoxin oxidoreductase alpha subunit
MADFAAQTGRAYKPFDYEGDPEADRVIVIMGSGGEAVAETVGWLNANGQKTGVVKVRLYRPFSVEDFAAVLPKSVKSIAVLDRTKEPGALGEPLYLDVSAALRLADSAGWLKDTHAIRLIGGRYGLGSKEFTPAMIKAVFDELLKPSPKPVFTVSGGVNTVEDIIKAIMCGASVVQVVSSLLKYGPSHIGPLITGLSRWLEEHDYKSVEEMRGSMSHLHCPDPSVFERANYLRVLQLWKV